MKVGLISHVYLPHIGGLENYVYRLKQSLEKTGNQVEVYTTDMDTPIPQSPEKKVFYSKTSLSILRNPFSVQFFSNVRNSSCTVYHLQGYEFITSLLSTVILKDKPKVLTQHGAEIQAHNFATKVVSTLYSPFARYILKNMDFIIVLGKKDKLFMQRAFNLSPEKIVVIPNGIEIGQFTQNRTPGDGLLEKYHLQKESSRILFVSRLIETKNAHKLISAVTQYIKDEAIEVIIVGSGDSDYIARLKQMADNRVHFLQDIDSRELAAAYGISDLFVHLGEWSEGLPTTILEAMASGLPVLTPDAGNIADVVTEGENGFFLRTPIDERELAEKIQQIMKIDRNVIGQANKEKIANEYNWSLITRQIVDVYQKALQEHSTR